MTDRDTFAAAALTGLLVRWHSRIPSDIGEVAYKCADAMLRERETRAEVSYTLTDEEREAVERACDLIDNKTYGDSTTLRRLLERLR